MTEQDGFIFQYNPSLVFEANEEWTYSREPVIHKMPNGDIVCWLYAGGEREPDDENCILQRRSKDNGETWEELEIAFDHPCRAVWGTELFTDCAKTMGFLHTFQTTSAYTELNPFVTYTNDSGETWTEPSSLPGIPGGIIVRQGAVLDNGNWIFPVYWMSQKENFEWEDTGPHYNAPTYALGRKFESGCMISKNLGKSFTLRGFMTDPKLNLWEPAIVELSENHLLMLMRADGSNVLYKSESFNGGETWNKAQATDIPNPGTKFVIRKINEKIVLINNPNTCEEKRKSIELWVSEDECETWSKKIKLAEVAGEVNNLWDEGGRVICYPHVIADDQEEILYVALDAVRKTYLIKVPYADFLQ